MSKLKCVQSEEGVGARSQGDRLLKAGFGASGAGAVYAVADVGSHLAKHEASASRCMEIEPEMVAVRLQPIHRRVFAA